MQGIFLTAALVEAVAPGLGQATLGGVVGYALGFALKKIIKILLIFTGVFIALTTVLASQNIISVNWPLVENYFNEILQNSNISFENLIQWLGAYIPVTGGLVAGFFIGFRKG